MIRFTLLALASLSLACSIAPVVTDPSSGGSRFDDCRRAAKDYCRNVVQPSDAGMKKCVSEATFKCVSAGG